MQALLAGAPLSGTGRQDASAIEHRIREIDVELGVGRRLSTEEFRRRQDFEFQREPIERVSGSWIYSLV